MERAYQFYTDVLGGTEVFRHGDFKGDGVHNTCWPTRRLRRTLVGSIPVPSGSPICGAARSGWMSASFNSTTWCLSCCSIASPISRWALRRALPNRWST
ncbi:MULTISPECIES: hypothetical protein [unclassified Bradyrhizobium]|uniref:hypothetical protein n=1 Tax=unclassified Bradyrhizobium TaxID=2631580 RepID=UPI00339322FC